MAQPEHALQVRINIWQRECIPAPHAFWSMDRRAATGMWSHAREKARGAFKGTSDTILLFPGIPAILVELKAPGRRPDEAQQAFGITVTAAGHRWGWCDSVSGYCAVVKSFGVPLLPYAEIKAAHYDAVLEGFAIKAEEAKTGVVSKKRYAARPAKATAAQIARAHKTGVWAR